MFVAIVFLQCMYSGDVWLLRNPKIFIRTLKMEEKIMKWNSLYKLKDYRSCKMRCHIERILKIIKKAIVILYVHFIFVGCGFKIHSLLFSPSFFISLFVHIVQIEKNAVISLVIPIKEWCMKQHGDIQKDLVWKNDGWIKKTFFSFIDFLSF